jgi:hypothetical protein
MHAEIFIQAITKAIQDALGQCLAASPLCPHDEIQIWTAILPAETPQPTKEIAGHIPTAILNL